MIILYNGRSVAVKNRFAAEKLSVSLSERQSTASMTLSGSAPALAVGDWVGFESGPGKGIVWRVKTIDTQYDTDTRTVSLEHLIMALKDTLMFGEVKNKDISGSNANPTAKQAVQYILRQQSDWTLGTFADAYGTVKNPYNFNGDDLYAALETVSSTLQDCIWEYSFSSYPFKLNIRKMTDDVVSEMRTDRNIRTLKKTVDRSRMYTRHYPIGKNNLHIDGNFVSKNENTYGIISKVETDQSISTKAELKAWAQERLNRHCDPLVTVTVSGLELADATGETLDRFTIGKKCRIPLPEFGTSITERVTKLNYSDALNDPENVTITMANELMDVTKILKATTSGKSARTHAKNSEDDHAWIVDTKDKVELVAEAVAGKDNDGNANWSRVATLTVDGNGIQARVTQTEEGIKTHETRISQTEKDIDLEAEARKSEDKSLSGKINVQGGKIALVVEEKDGKNVVKAASIVTAINDAGSSVCIEADHIYITGTTKLSGTMEISDGNLLIKKAVLVSGTNGNISMNNGTVSAKTHQINQGGTLKFVGSGTGEYYDLTTAILKGMIKSFSVANNILTLTPFYGDPVNFSRATSLSGAWGASGTADEGYYVVTASPQGNKLRYNPPMRLNGSIPYDNRFSAEITDTVGSVTTAKKTIYGYLKAVGSGANASVIVNTKADGTGETVATISIGADYQTWWNAGWDNAADMTEPPAIGDGETFVFKAPLKYEDTPGHVVREQYTYNFSMSTGTPAASGYASVMLGGNRVGRISIGEWYQAGWEKAAEEVTFPEQVPSGVDRTTFDVTVKTDASGTTVAHTFTLGKGSTPGNSGYASVSLSGYVVGRINIGNWYSSGWKAASQAIEWPEDAPSGVETKTIVITYPTTTSPQTTTRQFKLNKTTPSANGGFAYVTMNGHTVGQIQIGNWYDKGYKDAANAVSLPSTAGSGEVTEFSLTIPAVTSDGAPTTEGRTFNLTNGATPGSSGYATVTMKVTGSGTSGNAVGRINIGNWYDAGWKAARDGIVWPSAAASGTEVISFDVKTPTATVGSFSNHTFTLAKGATPGPSGFVGVALSGTVVGRIQIGDWYTAGQDSVPKYPQAKTMTCTGATFTQSQWKYTFEYYNSSSGLFTTGNNYKFHNNSGYT